MHRTECKKGYTAPVMGSDQAVDIDHSVAPRGSGGDATSEPDPRVTFREPCQADAAEIWELVEACDELDLNSPYAYLLLCTDFCETGLVARIEGGSEDAHEGELVAFVLGYRRPSVPDALFVWQIGVAPSHRGKGMGARLLGMFFDRCQARDSIDMLEATVTPSNVPSRTLFSRFARDRSAAVEEAIAFDSKNFPAPMGEPHEDEIRLRIGPIRSGRA